MGIEENPPPPKQRSITFLSMEEQGTITRARQVVFLQQITLSRRTCLLLIVVAYVGVMRKLWFFFFSIVRLLMLCGVRFFLMFGVRWVMPRTVVSLLFAWRNWLGNYFSNVWNKVPICLMQLVWKERNAKLFQDIERPIDLVKTLLAASQDFI